MDEPRAALRGPEAKLVALLQRPRLPRALALVALLLSSPCLFLGFYIDDFVARYIYSSLPGAKRLFDIYMGGYGLADGNPAHNHWQIEAGYAPWWIYDHLRLRLFRPLGVLTHALDAWLWPGNAVLMHAHSLLWLALLVLATTRMYRGLLGPVAGGMAGLLFAFDHTHGFEVGYICNRYVLVAALLGVLCLDQHIRARSGGGRAAAWAGPLLYVLALLAGESSIAIGAYLIAYELLAQRGPWLRRARAALPYVAITLLWRACYNLTGLGASGSGPYVDPAREPLHFLSLLLARGPILLLGQFLLPPAEAYVALPQHARALLIAAVLFAATLALLLWPLLRRDRVARFWAAGMLLSLLPAACTYPNNRQLLFTSFGAMALIAQLWHMYAIELRARALSLGLRWSNRLGSLLLAMHLLVSPLLLPLTTCGVAIFGALQHGALRVGDELAGRDVVFLTAPDYLAVKLVQLSRRIDRRPLARRWRALSFGPQRVVVTRTDARTLELDYEGGILGTPFLELYRDRRLRMAPGERVSLQGLQIEVLAVTSDGRARRARFSFDRSLDAPSFVFYAWLDGGFERLSPPAVGTRRTLPAAQLPFALK